MLNALESQRANPRARPPHMTGAGLFSRPTVVNNVETYMAVPAIVRHGAGLVEGPLRHRRGRHQDLRRRRPRGQAGLRRAARWARRCASSSRSTPAACCPGTRCAPSARAAPRRPSSPPTRSTCPWASPPWTEVESRLGTGTLVLLDDQTCPVGMTLNMMQFFAQESCGWCTPCREGLQWMAALLEDIEYGRGRAGRPRGARRGRLVHGVRQVLLRPRAGRHAAARERAAPVPRRLRAPRRRGRLPLPAPRLGRAGACGGRPGERQRTAAQDRHRHHRRRRVPGRRGPQHARRRPLARLRPAVLLLAPRAGLHRRLPPVRRAPLLDRPRGQREERDRHGLHDRGAGGHADGHRRRRGDPLPRRDDRAHDAQPPARLPRLRRGRRVPPAGHDGDDRAQLPALPRPQADVREPGPGTVRHARAEPLHHLLPLHALLQRLRRRPRLRRVRPAQPGVLRARRERHAGERVQRQPHRGLPHRRVRRQAVLAPLLAQVGPADGAVGVPGLRPGLHDDALGALRRAAPRAGPLQPRRQQDVPLRPRPVRLRVRQRAGARARGAGRGRPAAAAGGGGRGGCAGRGRRGGRGRARRRCRSPSRRPRRAPASARRRGPAPLRS